MKDKYYYIYIATNYTNTTLYTGVTNNLVRRMFEHKEKLIPGFTEKYNINKLVYYEIFEDINEAMNYRKLTHAVSLLASLRLVLTTFRNSFIYELKRS